jgi:hypothetical protein
MRLYTAADLHDGVHRSQADKVRITPRPRWARTAHWFNWAGPGGWTWTYAWLWVFFLLWIFGLLYGYNFPRVHGISHELPAIRLSTTHVQRVIGGQPIRDNSGNVLLDPQTTGVTILSIDETGRAELRYRSDPGIPGARETVIVIPAPDCEYRHVVRAIESIESGELDLAPPPDRLWLAAAH